MFGSVPRAVWERLCPPDAHNRIQLVARALWLDDASRSVLIDQGTGSGPDEPFRQRFAIEPTETLPFAWEDLTDLVPTHLHFDHAGGLLRWTDGESPHAEFAAPQATIHLAAENWERACRPGPRERASYLPALREALHEASEEGRLRAREGDVELFPGVEARVSHGHTRGMRWLTIADGSRTIAFPADLVPTTRHIHLPFVMGYDMCVEALLKEKEAFLKQAVEEEWVVVFAHDPETSAARVRIDGRGRYSLGEVVDL